MIVHHMALPFFDIVIEDLHEVFRQLKSMKIRLGIENGDALQDHITAVDKVGIDRFGLVLDTTHPIDNLSGTNPLRDREKMREEIRRIGSRLIHVHMSDRVDGRQHLPPFFVEGGMPWDEFFSCLDEIAYRGAVIAESSSYAMQIDDVNEAEALNKRLILAFPEEFERRYS